MSETFIQVLRWTANTATPELLHDEECKVCHCKLSETYLAEMKVRKKTTDLFPILCTCGGITVIGEPNGITSKS